LEARGGKRLAPAAAVGSRLEALGKDEEGSRTRDEGRWNVLEAAHTIESTQRLVISTALNADLYIISHS